MTPEEAIEIIHEKHMDMEFYFAEHDRYPKYYDFDFDQATLIAAQALKEIQQYREIGTVEECKGLASIVNMAEKEELAKIIDEWLLYSKIGTVEECREAVEKQKAKELVYESDSVFSNGFSHYRMGKCPMCDRYYNSSDEVNYCSKCGQALMNENLEGMEE